MSDFMYVIEQNKELHISLYTHLGSLSLSISCPFFWIKFQKAVITVQLIWASWFVYQNC